MNFIQKCLDGDEDLAAIDDYVAEWHEKEDDGVELHDYLGMTWDEYSLWAEKPNALPYILRARKFSENVVELIEQESQPLAARASTTDEAQRLMGWLQQTGRIVGK